MAKNSLQAMLDRAKTAEHEAMPITPKAHIKATGAPPTTNQIGTAKIAKGRAATKLIGGHFAPEVSMQLRMIAAEENTTIQNLLAEALDDLFVKKNKKRMSSV